MSARPRRTAFDLGGAPGARHLASEGVAVGARPLLRLPRAAPLPVAGPVRLLSVGDGARRRGRTHGTLLVNLETHDLIDVLPDRAAGTRAAWLARHPEIEVVSRDRAGASADGIRRGAPQALRVADRRHLMKNVGAAVERALTRRYALSRAAAAAASHDEQERLAALCPDPVADPPADAFPVAPLGRPVVGRVLAQQRRLHLARKTGRQLAAATLCPERVPRRHLPAPFEPYRRYRRAQGCRNARAPFDELRAPGAAPTRICATPCAAGATSPPPMGPRPGSRRLPPRRCPAYAPSHRGWRAGPCSALPGTAMTASAPSRGICSPCAPKSRRSSTWRSGSVPRSASATRRRWGPGSAPRRRGAVRSCAASPMGCGGTGPRWRPP